MPSQRHPECRKELVAQRLLIVIVFRSHHREDRTGASHFEQVANAHRFACARISNDHMPGTIVPGGTQHRLETFFKRGLDEDVLSEEGMGHGGDSSRNVRTGST